MIHLDYINGVNNLYFYKELISKKVIVRKPHNNILSHFISYFVA